MHSRRKLLFYTHAMTGGGAERVWALLASGFARRDCDVILAVDYEAADNLGFVDPRVRLVVLGGDHARATLRLSRLIGAEKPDVTFSAIGVSNLKHLAAAALAGRLANAVQSYHGYFVSEPQALSRLAYLLTPLTSRLFARTLAVSDGLHDYLVRTWRARASRAARIYNPVLVGADAAPSPRRQERFGGKTVLAAGRFVSYKNFAGLVRAFARVRDSSARLVILGEGPQRPAIEAEIARHGLGGRVLLPGYQPEPWRYFREADCFALASHSESFGLVVVEALAHGLPVVATDCHGPREILDHGRYGRLTPIGDEAAMARGIEAALVDEGGGAARIERARSFSVDIAIDHYAALADEVTGKASLIEAPPPRRRTREAA